MPIVPSAGVSRRTQKSSTSSRQFGGGQRLPDGTDVIVTSANPVRPIPSARTQSTVKQFAFHCGDLDTSWMSEPGHTPKSIYQARP